MNDGRVMSELTPSPRPGDHVTVDGHGGWIVWAVEPEGVWVYGAGWPMTTGPDGQAMPGHMVLTDVSQLRPAAEQQEHLDTR